MDRTFRITYSPIKGTVVGRAISLCFNGLVVAHDTEREACKALAKFTEAVGCMLDHTDDFSAPYGVLSLVNTATGGLVKAIPLCYNAIESNSEFNQYLDLMTRD